MKSASRGDAVRDHINSKMTVSSSSALGPRSVAVPPRRNVSSAFMPAGLASRGYSMPSMPSMQGIEEGMDGLVSHGLSMPSSSLPKDQPVDKADFEEEDDDSDIEVDV